MLRFARLISNLFIYKKNEGLEKNHNEKIKLNFWLYMNNFNDLYITNI